MRSLTLLLATACATDAATCPDADPGLELGTGERAYADLDAGTPALTLVHGPQGGYHLDVGLAATGLDEPDAVVVALEATVDGELLADQRQRAPFRCDPETGRWLTWGLRLVYDAEPEDLDERDTTITATLPDLGVSDTRTVHIVDPLVEN